MLFFTKWRNSKLPAARRNTRSSSRAPASLHLHLEVLEDRRMLSTLTVTSINDSGVGSLRAEIAAAHSGDTIVFDSGLAGQTITLISGELVINKSLTIEGTPGGPEAISASPFSRVLYMTGAANVTLDNLVIENGFGVEGAGIYNNGGTVTINDSALSGNSTNSPYYNGGGIYNSGGTVTVSNSAVVSYYDYFGGGGIYNTAGGTVIVEYFSSITGNIGGYFDGEDVYNLGVVYLDGTSTIGYLAGNPAIPLDPNTPQLRIRDTAVMEGNTGSVAAKFTINLSAPSTKTISVAYATADGAAAVGSDYQAASGRLTFAPGQTSKTVSVLVNGDRLGESHETFYVNLSAATNAIITAGHGIGTIVDDEPHISISDVTKAEGKRGQTTLFTFTVALSAAYDQPVTMSFRTVNGTAQSGLDYIAKTGTMTFAPGETTKTITIEVKGDSKKEANEVFYLDLFGNSSNSLFTKYRGIGTILNDD